VLERWPERFVVALTHIAKAGPGAVLIHCQAGRDRTGLLAAALLAVAGVTHEAIVDDYAQSGPCLQPLYDRWIAAAADQAERERIRRANSARPAVMRRVLERVDLAAYLRAHGLSAHDEAALGLRLVPCQAA